MKESQLRKIIREELVREATQLTPGKTYTLEEFANSIKGGFKAARRKFEKDNSNGWWSYADDEKYREEDYDRLMKILGYGDNADKILKYFNSNYMPFDIKIKELGKEQEEVKSNNIYDKMGAKTITEFNGSFKVKVKYDDEPITVERIWKENTTLRQSDIHKFMRM